MIKILKGLLMVTAKKDVRYCLNGIHVKCVDSVVTLSASDGHTGMILDIKDDMFNVEDGTSVILCRESLTRVLKMYNAKSKPVFTINNEGANIDGHNIDLVDGRFPDVHRAFNLGEGSIPDKIKHMEFNILSTLCRACSLVLHGNAVQGGCFEIRDAGSPIHITQTFGENSVNSLRAVIMPMRL